MIHLLYIVDGQLLGVYDVVLSLLMLFVKSLDGGVTPSLVFEGLCTPCVEATS